MTDPVEAFRVFLEEGASMPHFFVLTLTFVLIAMMAHGTAELGKRYARDRKWNALALLLVLLGTLALLWWTPLVGAPVLVVGLVLLLWRPTRAVTRAARNHRDRRNRRQAKEARP